MEKLRIISGGQTGVDRIGLEVGRELGLDTGGMAPYGYKTENGPDLTLREFGLTTSNSSSYNHRTLENIWIANGTIIFGNINSPGSKLTIQLCKEQNKPYLINPNPEQIENFIRFRKIKTLNIAGNRASKISKEDLDKYRSILVEGLRRYIDGTG